MIGRPAHSTTQFRLHFFSWCIVFLLSLGLAGCDGSGGNSTTAHTPTLPTNQSPIADAGVDQSVNELTSVTLDGSASSDADGTIASYAWRQTAGTTVALSAANIAKPMFIAPNVAADETLTFELTVVDDKGGSAKDVVVVTIIASIATTTLKSDVVVVDTTTSSQIVSSTATSDDLTQIDISGNLAADVAVDKIFHIPPGVDDRFPFGISGHIDEVSNSNGKTSVVLSPVTYAEVVQESTSQVREIPLNNENFIGVITPGAVTSATSTNALLTGSQLVSKNGIVFKPQATTSLFEGGSVDAGEIGLNLNIKLKEMEDDPSKIKPYGAGAEVAIVVSGGIKNLKLIESHDFSLHSGLTSLDFRVQGDISAEIKLTGGVQGNLGYYSRAWKEVADQQMKLLGQSAKLSGLDSQDKIGKYPVAGLVFSLACTTIKPCIIKPGTTQTPLRLAQAGGVIVWLYATAAGELTLDGELGGRLNAGTLNTGLTKPVGGSTDFQSTLSATSDKRLIEAPFFEREVKIAAKFGIDMAVDLFLSGIRVMNTELSLVRVEPNLSLKMDSKISFGAKNWDSPWSWEGNGCLSGGLGVGMIAKAAINLGVELDTTFGKGSAEFTYESQLPSAESMLLPGLHGTWYRYSPLNRCFPEPTVSAVFSSITGNTVKIIATGTYLPSDLQLVTNPASVCHDVRADEGNSSNNTEKIFTCTVDDPITQFTYKLLSDKAQNLNLSAVANKLSYSNHAPVADAGSDQHISINTTTIVNLSGSNSSDPDGDTLSYEWVQSGGTPVTLTDANTATPSFTSSDATTTVIFTLTVRDGRGGVSTDTVNITINLPAPTNLTVTPLSGNQVTLTWSSVKNAMGYGVCSSLTSIPDSAICDTSLDSSGSIETTATTVTLSGATYIVPHYFRVVAIYQGVSSELSNQVYASSLLLKSPLLTPISANEAITLTWDPILGATSYDLCYTTTPMPDMANWDMVNCSAVTNGAWLLNVASPLNVPNLINGTTYYFRLQAKGENGLISFPSEQVIGTPQATTVTKGKLNDTGMILCGNYPTYYDNGFQQYAFNSLDCSLTNYIGNNTPIPAGQDGHSGRDVTHNDNSDGYAGFSFTKISSKGQALPASATEWACVQDNVTGLMWEVKTDDGGLHDKDWKYTWYEPDDTKNGGFAGIYNGGACGNTSVCNTASYVAAVNTTGWCGHTDWRMPMVDELSSISRLDHRRYYNTENPAIDTDYFPNTTTPSQYRDSAVFWSASPTAYADHSAWSMNFSFYDGGLNSWESKETPRQVRLVRR